MNLYLDASALVKRYVQEPGSEVVIDAMRAAGSWWISRVGYPETLIAISAGRSAVPARRFRSEWPQLTVVEVDQPLVEGAAKLGIEKGLRTLDALHLAAALLVPGRDRALATWDARMWSAARELGFELIPERLDR